MYVLCRAKACTSGHKSTYLGLGLLGVPVGPGRESGSPPLALCKVRAFQPNERTFRVQSTVFHWIKYVLSEGRVDACGGTCGRRVPRRGAAGSALDGPGREARTFRGLGTYFGRAKYVLSGFANREEPERLKGGGVWRGVGTGLVQANRPGLVRNRRKSPPSKGFRPAWWPGSGRPQRDQWVRESPHQWHSWHGQPEGLPRIPRP